MKDRGKWVKVPGYYIKWYEDAGIPYIQRPQLIIPGSAPEGEDAIETFAPIWVRNIVHPENIPAPIKKKLLKLMQKSPLEIHKAARSILQIAGPMECLDYLEEALRGRKTLKK
jgi:hypothetical protein